MQEEEGSGIRGRSAYVVALLFFGYLLSFADRIVFGLVLKPVKAALSLSDSEAGLLVGVAFAVTFAVCSPLGGIAVDRGWRRSVFGLAVLVWSAATFCTGLAASFATMFAARAAVGAGEAMLNPVAVSMIGSEVPAPARPKAFSIYFSAGMIGTVVVLLFGGALLGSLQSIGAVTLPLLGTVQPWQMLLVALAVPGLVLVALVFTTLPGDAGRPVPAAVAVPDASIAGFMRGHPVLCAALLVGYPAIQMGAYTTLSWMFVFLDRAHGWPASKAGPVFALSAGLALVAGCLSAGSVIAAAKRRGFADAAVLACLGSGLAFAFFAALALVAPSPALAIAAFTAAFLFGNVPTISAFSAVAEVVPPVFRARFAGLNTLTIGLITNSAGPFLAGFLSDRLFPGGDGLRWALLLVVGASALGGGTLLALGLRPFRRCLAAPERRAMPAGTRVGLGHA